MIHVFISGSGMDWALSPLSRLLTVAYLIVGAPIMFMYLRTTGGAAARGLRYAFTTYNVHFSGVGASERIFFSYDHTRSRGQ